MTNKEYYINEIRSLRAEIAHITEERTKFWNSGERTAYKKLSHDIGELNVRIKDLMEIYEISESEI